MTSLRLQCVALSLAASACMLSPYDGQRFASQTTPVPFNGYNFWANTPVSIRAFNPATATFEQIATTPSAATADPLAASMIDEPLYKWQLTTAVPPQYWVPGAVRGARARVKATTRPGSTSWAMTSVERDWGACMGTMTTSSASEFGQRCKSDHNPEAWIMTSDYCHEGPPPLPSSVPTRVEIEVYCTQVEYTIVNLGAMYPAAEIRVAWRGREELNRICNEGSSSAECFSFLTDTNAALRSESDYYSARNADDLMVAYRARTTPGATCDAVSPWVTLPVRYVGFHRCPTAPTPPPPPPPPATSGPDLTLSIAPHDGLFANVTVCNNGSTVVMGNRWYLSVRPNDVGPASELSMESLLPSDGLNPTSCHTLFDVGVGTTSGTGGGGLLPSSSVRICADSRGQILETNESNNCDVE
ncbi:MAG: hypothetical protein JNK82_05290 [Myxococcaceae bacterium]|nr:hypothetical protein [Myxococcaceae bacterium]